ncbi:polysaccharide biosynthesis C-terminal domain-containing protein [Paenarthrobacter sp. PH39-S1]|uniref:oligosaccharide flippase family protein n=1 Tax=Paenarthrobacter sp. PH39-S1 TaxID=3046204 RepID=UPI0024B8FE50|nr:polysaccharide biosynthesis C-terminal domain-containing protein [Paenarthrobacter sp. PH39-S1]MDJ0356114.1 polysaccharide biosynthesis C-terminal domain-containing protein [Paenarthrobacter sp. PH39-S1]
MSDQVIQQGGTVKHDHADEARQAARGGLVSMVGAGTSAVMGFVLTLVLARSFGTAGSGVVLQVIAVFSIALGIARTGMDTAGIWILPRLALSDVSKIRGAVMALLVPTAGVGIVMALLLVGVLPQLGLSGEGNEGEVLTALSDVTWFLPFAAIMMVALAATRGLGNVVPYTVVGAIALPMSRPVAVLLVVAVGGPAVWAALAWAMPLPLAMIAALWALWMRLRRHEQRGGVKGSWLPDRGVFARIWKFALPRWFSSGIEQSIVWFDVILVGAIAGAGAAGVYGAASRFVSAGLIISTAMRMVISPRFSALLSENKTRAVQELYSTTVTWIVLLGAPIYGLFMFFAPTALGWLGKGFQSGALALIILCVGAITSLLAGNVDSVLMMSGRSGWMAANKSVVLAINIAGNVVLVPVWGIVGAAATWAFSLLLDAAMASIETRIFIGIRFDAKRVFYALFVAAVCVVPASVLAIVLLGNTTVSCLVAGVMTVVLLVLWCSIDRKRLRMNDLALLSRRGKTTTANATAVV